jgi:hypothetical protein
MFDNIGEKIKGVGKFVCYSGIAMTWISVIVFLSENIELIFLGLLIGGAGSVASWVGSLAFVGFGEIIIRLTSIDDGLKRAGVTKDAPPQTFGYNGGNYQGGQGYYAQPTQYVPTQWTGYPQPNTAPQEKKYVPNYSCQHIVVCNDLTDTGTCQECYTKNVKRTFCQIKCDLGTKERRICDEGVENFKKNVN